jgi:hypothetical protein
VTLVTIHTSGSPGRFFGWATPLMARQVRKSIAADLVRLRDCLETPDRTRGAGVGVRLRLLDLYGMLMGGVPGSLVGHAGPRPCPDRRTLRLCTRARWPRASR